MDEMEKAMLEEAVEALARTAPSEYCPEDADVCKGEIPGDIEMCRQCWREELSIRAAARLEQKDVDPFGEVKSNG
jgi:hypothetical protein